MPIPDYNLQFQTELEKLNLAQQQAVFHTEGPVLVIAGPGTGKTQILSARIGHILSSKNIQVSPHNILCLTYTDAGVIAMRNRLLKLIGPDAYRVHIHTFHSFCNQVIQSNMDYFGIRDLHPISELETIEVFHKLIDQFPAGHPLKKYSGEIYSDLYRLKALFSTMKTENWSPDFISSKIDEYIADLPNREKYIYKVSKGPNKKGDPKLKLIQEETDKMEKLRHAAFEYENFNKLMKSVGRYDFDDMILWVLQAFKQNEILRLRYQEQYLYFLVDEYQDTNGSQNEILNLLTEDADENPNVFVVGDDDQSIYRFQGANLKNITDYALRYQKNLYKVVLTENYRSTQPILDTAQTLISFNNQRLVNTFKDIQKNLLASLPQLKASLNPPQIKKFVNPQNEEAFLLKEIERLQEEGVSLSEVAVIYRKHKLVENLVKVMEQKKIPLNLKQRVNVLDVPFIKNLIQLLTYLQLESERPHSAENLLFEIMHYDFFEISSRDIARISLHCSHLEEGVYKKWREVICSRETLFRLGLESSRAISTLEENLSFWLKSLMNDTIQVLFEKIVTKGGILKYIMNSPDKIWLMESLTSFFDFIKSHAEKEEYFNVKKLLDLIEKMKTHHLCIYLNKIISNADGVNFVTAHSSKGLEFKYVYLISANANCWEKSRSTNRIFRLPDTVVQSLDEDLEEEERRLFYVAVTRAKEHLTITYTSHDRNGKEVEKSRFITEIKTGGIFDEDIDTNEEDLLEFNFLNLSMPQITTSDLINRAYIEASLKSYRMSVTHLSKYLRCPLTFYFENIIKVPSARNESMGFGNAIHYTMEKFFKSMLESDHKQFGTEEELFEIFKKGMHKYHAHFTKEQFKRKMEYGLEILPGFHKTYVDQWNKIAVVEYRLINVETNGVPLTGILDKLEFDGNLVNVVDYKTGKPENGIKKLSPPSETDPLGGDYWRQMVFYKILMDSDKTRKWEMISGEFDFIEKNAQKEYVKRKLVISPEDISIVRKQISEVYAKILNHEFLPGCGKEDCQWCSFVRNNFASEVNLSVIEEE